MVGRRLIYAVVALSLLSACAGGGNGQPTATLTAVEGADVTGDSVAIGETVWFAGFKLTMVSAELVVEATGGSRVDIETMFANEGSSNATLNATLNLSSAGQHYQPDSFEQDLPEVPGKTTGSGTLSFVVDEAFTFDDALLTIGNPDNNQAVVPLGLAGELVDLAPEQLDISGSATGGELRVRVRAGELRADIPDRHDQVEAGQRALSLDFDVSYIGDFAGGYAFGHGNLALTLPDGTTVAVDDGPIELLDAGTTLPDQRVRFTVRYPAEGTYELVVIDDTIDERGTLTFEIA